MKTFLNHFSTKPKIRTAFILCMAILAVVIIIVMAVGMCKGEEYATVWIMCKPGSQVNVRRTPSENGQIIGFLEAGDSFETDGSSVNGFIRAYGVGESDGYIWCGNVVTEEPEECFEQYVCVAKTRVACRRWIDGPQTSLPWLKNGSNVQVFYIADSWACTSRGYILSEWLEVDPE